MLTRKYHPDLNDDSGPIIAFPDETFALSAHDVVSFWCKPQRLEWSVAKTAGVLDIQRLWLMVHGSCAFVDI
jgi:hypothetical protein